MATGKRMKAAERRELILDAAIEEYGRTGMHEVSTEVIAERAGVSQPYLFRLFGTKKDLIIAAIRHHTERVREVFRMAVADRGDDTPLEAMGVAYVRMLTEDPNSLRCQLHTWAAASDPDIGPVARETYLLILDDIRELSGADHDTVMAFLSRGMLLTVAAALDIPEIYNNPPVCPQES